MEEVTGGINGDGKIGKYINTYIKRKRKKNLLEV